MNEKIKQHLIKYNQSKGYRKAGELTVISDEEIEKAIEAKLGIKVLHECRKVAQAQLLACKKAHAGMTKELIREIITEIQNADEPDGMAMCSDPYRYTVNKIVETLKAKYGG